MSRPAGGLASLKLQIRFHISPIRAEPRRHAARSSATRLTGFSPEWPGPAGGEPNLKLQIASIFRPPEPRHRAARAGATRSTEVSNPNARSRPVEGLA